jgi:hypothetical protein
MVSPLENIQNRETEMKTLLRLAFELRGDFDPHVITREVALEPSEIWRKGDPGTYKGTKQYDYWCLDTGYVNTLDLEEMSKDVYSKLKLKREQFSKVIAEYDLTAVFVVVAKIDNGNTPSLCFSKDIVKLGGEFGAFFDIDLYVNP